MKVSSKVPYCFHAKFLAKYIFQYFSYCFIGFSYFKTKNIVIWNYWSRNKSCSANCSLNFFLQNENFHTSSLAQIRIFFFFNNNKSKVQNSKFHFFFFFSTSISSFHIEGFPVSVNVINKLNFINIIMFVVICYVSCLIINFEFNKGIENI